MKRKPISENVSLDEKGKRRFHGAFTGGFSAGYFNTVGSAEGWKPSTFVSSRMNRAQPISQSTQDFMDNEDGLLGEILITKEDFDTFGKHITEYKDKFSHEQSSGSAIPGPIPSEMIVASSRPIGIKLLQQMGWKEGQGIGSRRKRRMRDGKDGIVDLGSINLPSNVISNGEILFSAVDESSATLSQIPKPKVDKYGIGFNQHNHSISSTSQDLVTHNRWNIPTINNSIDTKIGTGMYRLDDIIYSTSVVPGKLESSNNLAVGKLSRNIDRDIGGFALDDDEDDVYENPHNSIDYTKVSTFHQPMATKLHSELELSFQNDDNHPLLMLSEGTTASIQMRCKTDNKLPLPGFHVSEQYLHSIPATKNDEKTMNSSVELKETSKQFQMKYFPPPIVPRNFIEKHNFDTDRYRKGTQLDSTVNEVVVDEGKGPLLGKGRLYEMLGAKGKEQINRVLALQSNTLTSTLQETSQPPPTQPQQQQQQQQQSFAAPGLAEALKGRFTSSSSTTQSSSSSSNLSTPLGGLVTALDLEKEKKMKAEHEQKILQTHHQQQSGPVRVVHRTTTIWAPNRLLCKRMNVPVPQITTESLLTPQAINVGREAEIFEKHIEKHISGHSNSFLQLPLHGDNDGDDAGDAGEKGNHDSIGSQTNYEKNILAAEKLEFQLEENVDPTTGIFIPEIKPQMSLLKSIFDDSESESDSEDEDEDEREREKERERESEEGKQDEADKEMKVMKGKSVSPSPPQMEIPLLETNKQQQQQQPPIKQNENEANGNQINDQRDTENETRVVFRKPTSRTTDRNKLKPTLSSKTQSKIISYDDDSDFSSPFPAPAPALTKTKDEIVKTKLSSSSSTSSSSSFPANQSLEPSIKAPLTFSSSSTSATSSSSSTAIPANQKTLERLKRALESQSDQQLVRNKSNTPDENNEDSRHKRDKKEKKDKKKDKKKSKKHKKEKKKSSHRSRSSSRSSRSSSTSSRNR